MDFRGKTDEYLRLSEITHENHTTAFQDTMENSLSILWNTGNEACLHIDKVEYCLGKNQLVFLTEFHKVAAIEMDELRLIQFNRAFYCIIDHDEEVGCKGILFFGASNVPVVTIPTEEFRKFDILWSMFNIELESKDRLQMEMLQMMLKRLIILCTRLNKGQWDYQGVPEQNLDTLREFNFLVESNFKTKHSVAEYAEMLNKSPKSLSNFFAKNTNKTPLSVIQQRLILEARRLLSYTDMPVKEIAYELGFDGIQPFSRFFKTKEKVSPMAYRKNKYSPSGVNTLEEF